MTQTVLWVNRRKRFWPPGQLVSDEIVNDMLVNRITKPDCKNGFLLDGYPQQSLKPSSLTANWPRSGFPAPTIFHLATPQSVLIERISSRRQCPQCGRIYNLLFQAADQTGRLRCRWHEVGSPVG